MQARTWNGNTFKLETSRAQSIQNESIVFSLFLSAEYVVLVPIGDDDVYDDDDD